MSKSGSHTPGPWHAWNRGIGWEVHAGAECPDPAKKLQCENVNGEFRETFTEANARLIAAAPDLWAVVKVLLARRVVDAQWFHDAELAIAKAEGRDTSKSDA